MDSEFSTEFYEWLNDPKRRRYASGRHAPIKNHHQRKKATELGVVSDFLEASDLFAGVNESSICSVDDVVGGTDKRPDVVFSFRDGRSVGVEVREIVSQQDVERWQKRGEGYLPSPRIWTQKEFDAEVRDAVKAKVSRCYEGWHIPTDEKWLLLYTDESFLQFRTDWMSPTIDVEQNPFDCVYLFGGRIPSAIPNSPVRYAIGQVRLKSEAARS